MKLDTIYFDGFRNLITSEIKFNSGLNLILGKNAQGKSNLLEGIYALGLGRSYRTNREEDVIEFARDSAFISGRFSSSSGDYSLGVSWEKPDAADFKKSIRFNGVSLQKLADFLDKAPMVMLSPDDMKIVRGAPENRRKMLDLLCCRIYSPMATTLRNYKKVLDSRNSWLKTPPLKRDPLLGEVLDQKLSSLGSDIILVRLSVIDMLKSALSYYFTEVFESPVPEIRYKTTVREIEAKNRAGIEKAFSANLAFLKVKEFERKHTLTGPHRDDFDLKWDNRSVRSFSSFGEIRRVSVAIKLAEMKTIAEKTGKEPILLIDDSLNEFDKTNMDKLFSHLIGNRQVFYATTEIDENFCSRLGSYTAYSVSKGEITLGTHEAEENS